MRQIIHSFITITTKKLALFYFFLNVQKGTFLFWLIFAFQLSPFDCHNHQHLITTVENKILIKLNSKSSK